ncbi:MAG: hypothetical protein EBR00_04080 [Gammaproteobacteria bacterium]|nr:hypothetical protein [Gammaproteobacteria bacterium]
MTCRRGRLESFSETLVLMAVAGRPEPESPEIAQALKLKALSRQRRVSGCARFKRRVDCMQATLADGRRTLRAQENVTGVKNRQERSIRLALRILLATLKVSRSREAQIALRLVS